MSGCIFDHRYVYPSDSYGGMYMDLDGDVLEVGEDLSDSYSVTVKTDKGTFKGYATTIGSFRAQPGYRATIRIYDIGGGWYPDYRIISLWKP